MQCPPEIAEIVCEILRTGLLRIRAFANAERAALEADHLHNLLELLAHYKPELLDYYWRVQRAALVDRSTTEYTQQFEPMWKALAKHVTPLKNQEIPAPWEQQVVFSVNEPCSPGGPRRSYMGISILVGTASFALLGVICGFTGLANFEDAVQPWEHAIAIGFNGAVYGFVLGLIAGCLIDRFMRKRIGSRNFIQQSNSSTTDPC